MTSRSIGRVISINSKYIVAELHHNIGNYLNTTEGVRFVGEIGSFITIEENNRKIVAEIISVEEKNYLKHELMNRPNSSRIVFLNLLGEIQLNIFVFGVSKMPLIFSEINLISEKDFKTVLAIDQEEIKIESGKTRVKHLTVGESVLLPGYDVKVDLDKFFGFHFAVLGNTGAGKSNSVARIIQNIFEKKNNSAIGASIIIFDSNGEYKAALENINQINSEISTKFYSTDYSIDSADNLSVPVWALSVDDWAVLLHASEKTQIPILRRAVEIAKIFYDSQNGNNVYKNHILASSIFGVLNSADSSPTKCDKLKSILVSFSTNEINLSTRIENNLTIQDAIQISFGEMKKIEKLQEFVKGKILTDYVQNLHISTTITYDLNQFVDAVNFAVLYEGSISSQRIQEYTATLTSRLQSLKETDYGKFLSKTEFENISDYIESILSKKQIVNIDISPLDDSSSEVIVKVFTKLMLDYLRKRLIKAEMPVHLLIEEAHRFVKNESSNNALGYNIFERVAKEGRKYGLLMGISSQRPSELSKTVISQCSNFIVHRVQNPDDLNYISRMVPYINDGIINRLTYLQTGHALIFGTSINLPTITKFTQAKPPTDSQNAKISERWYLEDLSNSEEVEKQLVIQGSIN